MSFLSVVTIFCLCLSSSFATYGPDYKPPANHKPHYEAPKVHKGYEPKFHYDSPKPSISVHEPKFHYDSPKPSISVHEPKFHYDSPKISVHEPSPLHEDEPIILGHEKPLYIRKSLHGIPAGPVINAAHPAPVPVFLDGGYSHGKVLDITAPIQVINHAPIVHERPILIRRPVVVSKGLSGTQDHLEKAHYAHSGLIHTGGYSHGHEFSVPVSKALHERTLVYGGHSHGYGVLGHGYGSYGHGHGGLAHGYGSLIHGYGSLGHGYGDVAHKYGDIAHKYGDIAHGYGDVAHKYGDVAHGYGDVTHGYGAHIAPAAYSAPLIVEKPKAAHHEQPKAYGHSHVGFVPSAPLYSHGAHSYAAHEKKY